MPKRKNADIPSVGSEIIRGLESLRDAARDGEPLFERFTMRRVELELEPRDFSAEEVKQLREMFHASQAVFAKLIGIAPSTLQSWEQGRRSPPAWARRLLELMDADPEPWTKMLKQGVRRQQLNNAS